MRRGGSARPQASTSAARADRSGLCARLKLEQATVSALVGGIGPGTETRSPMAAVVLGGLTVSTVLSLLVVPAFYVVSARLEEKLWKPAIEPAPAPEPHG